MAQHQIADHCLFHLLADITHPASVAVVEDIKMKLSWRDDTGQPTSAQDSPFKPPRA